VNLERLAEVLVRWLSQPGVCGQPRIEEASPAKAKTGSKVFNAEELPGRLMGDRPLDEAVIKGFLEDTPFRLNGLRQRLEEDDAQGARLQAQTLKGTAATVAAEGLYAIALALEQAGTDEQLDRCRRLLPLATDEFDRFRNTLESAGSCRPV
jgi:HPt (histidine-containing phosphotransfer) domain-containing protein